MSKDIKLKEVKNSVINNNVININDIAGKNKNITIEATLIDYKKFRLNNTTTTILKLEDNTGTLTGMFVGEYNDLVKNHNYKLRGNVVLIDNIELSDFNKFINDDIRKYTIGDKLLCITLIEKVKNKPLINSIKLSLFHNGITELVDIEIPIKAIEVLEINKISTSISYLKDGYYDEITECGSLSIRLSINKLKEGIVKTLMDDIDIYIICLYMNDGEEKNYALPCKYIDDSNNKLQHIKQENDKIFISFREEN